ncbi:MAG: alpha/beta fold hydrolase, partial [Parahaliea sp.]
MRIQTAPGVELELRVEGDRAAPAVVLLHGFPESAHSWRHQVGPLVEAGYRVVVPDQRGYAGSSVPAAVADYAARHLTADVVAILDALGIGSADIVGHDWGALVAWHMGFFHPERCRSIVGVSVPFNVPNSPPIQHFRKVHGDRFYYLNHFQRLGLAECELEADPERFLRAIWWAASAAAGAPPAPALPAEGTSAAEAFEAMAGGRRKELPAWLSDQEAAVYVEQFRRSGFFGPVSWYRNLDTNYHDTRNLSLERFSMP